MSSEALTLATRVYNEKQGLKGSRRATVDNRPLDLSWLQQPQLQRKRLRPLLPRRSQSLSVGTSDLDDANEQQRLQHNRLQSLVHLRRRLENTDLAARATADRQEVVGVVASVAAEGTHAAPTAVTAAPAAAAAAAVLPVSSSTVMVAPPAVTAAAAVSRAPRLADLAVRTPTADSAADTAAAFAAAADAATAALAQLHRAQGELHRKTAAAAAAAGTAASARTASKQQAARSTACAAMALEDASSKQAARLRTALQCTADYTVYCDLARDYGPLSDSEFTLTSTPGALYYAHCSSAASRVQAWWFRVWQPLRSKQLRAVLAIQAQVSSLHCSVLVV
jgi:hypothetical protein